jgi:iron complex outermembrane recepter protein
MAKPVNGLKAAISTMALAICGAGISVDAYAAESGGRTEMQASASQASADPAGVGRTETSPSEVADIVVTARKSSETLLRTPAAVQVLSETELVNRGVTDIVRLSNLVTGIVLVPNRQNVLIFSRGLGQSDGQPQTTPSVEVQIDGYNIPKLALQAALYDIANVQVLKGPQGILYGRNAIGGAVLINTKRPSPAGFQTEGFLEAGNYNAWHAFAAANVPLGENTAVRAAVDYNKHDGYFSTGANDLDNIAGRLAFLTEIGDRISIFVTASAFRRTGNGFANVTIPADTAAMSDPWYVTPVPTSGIVAGVDFNEPRNRGFFEARAHAFTGEVSYQVSDALTLTYVGGYLKFSSSQVNPYGNRPNGIFVNNSTLYFQEAFHDYQNEVRLNFKTSRVDLVAGVLQHRFVLPALVVRGSYPLGQLLSGPLRATESNYAVFASARITLAAGLRFEIGGRQSWDRKGAVGSLFGDPINLNPATFPDFRNFSYKFGLEYDARDNMLVYANVQTGYLPGAYQTVPAATLAALGRPRRYEPQTVTAYTAGIKARMLDGRLQLNAEAFYYDYRNFQVNQRVELIVGNVISFQTPYANIRKSRIYGVDIDLNARIGRDGRLTVGLNLLDPKIVDSGFTSLSVLQPNGFFARVADPSLKGYQLPNAPTVFLNLGYEHTFRLGNGARIVATVGTHYETKRYLDYSQPNVAGALQDPFWKTDIAINFHSRDDRWTIGVFGRNLENTPTYSAYQALPLRSAGVVVGSFGSATVDAPRLYGARVGFNFR